VSVGSGWAGFNLLRRLKAESYDVTLVSPRNYFVFTPLLAGTASGTLEFRAATEPVRAFSKGKDYLEATCTSIGKLPPPPLLFHFFIFHDLHSSSPPDPHEGIIECQSVFSDTENLRTFRIPYDRLVIAVGSYTNTFGVEGVKEYANYLKDVTDARKIRQRIMDCFEMAAQPGLSTEEKSRLLHFAVVGGGPTGVELSAELADLVHDDMSRFYPHLMRYTSITVYDMSSRILGSFDVKLSEYASKRFKREGISIRTGANVTRVMEKCLVIKEGKGEGKSEEIPYGLLVWATGIAANPLLNSLKDTASLDKIGRLEVDGNLRVLDKHGQALDRVYALGDCSSLKGSPLPATAQVANQQANYLGRVFKQISQQSGVEANIPPFQYKYTGAMAYVGGWRAVAEIGESPTKVRGSGIGAWIFWRSAYLNMSLSWKNKFLIPSYWLYSWIFGRDISRF
ncbi:MAG: FAD/NAD-P-binding domain-containing protein, partial [Piptocephalis tieghemiana]